MKLARPRTRPGWVDAPPRLVGDAYQMTIMVGPYTTRQECDAKLPEDSRKPSIATSKMCLGGPAGGANRAAPDYLRQLVKDQWEEVRQYSVGPMTQLHVLLQFDRRVKDRVLEEHQRAIVAGRLWLTGVGLTVGLAGLAVLYGYLRMTGAKGASSIGPGSHWAIRCRWAKCIAAMAASLSGRSEHNEMVDL